jgi:hypothetical protein
VLLALAGLAAALVPLTHGAGLAYGAAWIEWDPVHSTNYYAERPGGFVVVAVSLFLALAFAVAALMLLIAACTAAVTSLRGAR